MSTSVDAGALTLQVLNTVKDPTANNSTPAQSVQIQNASPFVLHVSSGGEVYTLQSFTAQTIPTAGDAAGITILPINGPAGTQGDVQAIFLQPKEDPPMADGQLTGAAQYAQGLGQTLFGPATTGNGGGTTGTIILPPTARTLILSFFGKGVLALNPITSLQVIGNTSGYHYYAAPPYLSGPQITPHYLVVVPISGSIDPTLTVNYQTADTGNYTLTISADTAEYDESIFYNGTLQMVNASATAAGTVTILTGPARLLTAQLEMISTTTTGFIAYAGGEAILRCQAGTTGEANSTIDFPPNTILPAGQGLFLITAGTGSGPASTAQVGYAYP